MTDTNKTTINIDFLKFDVPYPLGEILENKEDEMDLIRVCKYIFNCKNANIIINVGITHDINDEYRMVEDILSIDEIEEQYQKQKDIKIYNNNNLNTTKVKKLSFKNNKKAI